jgi:outer membrane receptor protein involved in Fe transport
LKRPTSLLLIYCALLSSVISFGQELSISGFVDDAQGEPVGYANVLLMKAQDSTILKGVSTNAKGFFLLENLSEDTYMVKVSFLGFNDIYKTVILKENIDLRTIVLEESSEQLNEINIIAKRPTLKKEADRLVFNIENTALIEGNMFQVLKSTPGILVIDNNIKVSNLTPTVYINDKKVHLTSEELIQLLEASSANSIKSVEVIMNPSAKYDAESGAVINIVMSKNLITGYRGNVFANYTQGVFPQYDGGTSHFFKNEKIDFFANYTYSQDKINRHHDEIFNYLDGNNNIDQVFRSATNRNTWSKTHNFNFNFDYSINENNTLSISSTMLVIPYFEYLVNNNTNVFDSNQNLDYYFRTQNASDDDKYNLGFDLDYMHRFRRAGEKLTFNGHYTTYSYGRNQNVNSNYFDSDNTFIQETAFRTDNNQDTKIYTAQIDYVLPLSESSSIETGIKTSNINNASDISQFDIANGQETPDINNTDAFEYDETVFASYINFSKDWEKLSLIAGLRAEQTNIEGISVFDNIKNEQDYLEWFPTASLSYALTDKLSLYTNYKRSIQRPDYQSLNPFKFFLNDVTIVTGNPRLQPIFVDFTKIGASYKGFAFESYYKVSNDNFYQIPRQDNLNNTVTYTTINVDKTIDYGFDFSAYFNVMKNWSIYFVTSFYNIKDQGVFDNDLVSIDTWANYSVLSNDLSLLKDKSLNVNFTLTYVGKTIQGFQEVDERLVSNLSISKSVLNNQGAITFAAADLFNTQDFDVKTRYLNQSSSFFTDIDTRYIKLGFRYKFGNTKLQTNQRTNEKEETERLKEIRN